MALSDLADQYFGNTGVELAKAGSHCQQISQAIGDDAVSTSLIATIFWQAFIHSPAFVRALNRAGASPLAVSNGEKFVLRHGNEWMPRHDLIVFDPGFRPERSPSIIQPVDTSPDELVASWRTFAQGQYGAISSVYGGEILRNGPYAAAEAWEAQRPFGLIVASPHVVELTGTYAASCPSPALGVKRALDQNSCCTIGVIAQDGKGREGVTTAAHAVQAGTTVFIDGLPGTIDSQDMEPVTDSCFIEVPGITTRNVLGPVCPLTGMTPRINETVSFEREGGKKVDTTVIGWSSDLPWVVQPYQGRTYNQVKVMTKPITVDGDSGTALVDSTNRVIGFAFYITPFGGGFSAWIWAESVYIAHKLQ